MSKFRPLDILVEMGELCQDIMTELRQQLAYYRASVYKDEAADGISQKVEHLRLVATLFADELLLEPLRDYEAMATAATHFYMPGECSLSRRVSALLTGMETQLGRVSREVASRSTAIELDDKDFTQSLQRHRQQLIAICRHGSRQWAFFQAL